MEQKQLTPEELSNVKELALSLNNITSKFGQLKVEKLNLLTQITALEELENALDKDYFELKENKFSRILKNLNFLKKVKFIQYLNDKKIEFIK